MTAGLGEIFASWYSLINIAKVQRKKGHRVELIIDCTNALLRYYPEESIRLFFDLHKLQKLYFDEITVSTGEVNVGAFKQIGDMYAIKSNDLSDLEKYYWLTPHDSLKNGLYDAIFPNVVTEFVSSYVENYIKANNLIYNNAHHIRVIDGHENEAEALEIAKIVTPNLQDGDLVLSNSSTIKRVIKENTNKTLVEYNNPSEKLLSNHYLFLPSNVPKDLIFHKTILTYMEMILLTKCKHFHRYTIYTDAHWSAFLIHNAINGTNCTSYQIPSKTIAAYGDKGLDTDDDWTKRAYERHSQDFS
jgi:hypothetical protein